LVGSTGKRQTIGRPGQPKRSEQTRAGLSPCRQAVIQVAEALLDATGGDQSPPLQQLGIGKRHRRPVIGHEGQHLGGRLAHGCCVAAHIVSFGRKGEGMRQTAMVPQSARQGESGDRIGLRAIEAAEQRSDPRADAVAAHSGVMPAIQQRVMLMVVRPVQRQSGIYTCLGAA
jgi:hypothetical protein